MRFSLEKTSRLPRFRWWAILIAVFWIIIFAGGIILYTIGRPDIPLCGLKLIAGIPCPVCGSLRLTQALFRGNIGDAFLSNPLVFCLGIAGATLLGLRLVFGRVIKTDFSRAEQILAGATAILLVAANWTYLILDGR
jgi:hypothetical protein